jgi:REP element-mobilizing transposase RayT
MANTYTKCYFHLVFAVKHRNALISPGWKNELEKYITGIVQNHKHKMIAVYAWYDHIHILVGYNVNQLIPDLVEEIKISTNKWIKEKRLSPFRFEWQIGYGVFTVSQAELDRVANYINSQNEHHKKRSFKEEYLEILNKNEIEYKDEYLFEFFS